MPDNKTETFSILFVPDNENEKPVIFHSTESAKFAEDPSFRMTMSRIVDMTYRFYAGLITLSIQRLRELSDMSYWANAAKPVIHSVS